MKIENTARSLFMLVGVVLFGLATPAYTQGQEPEEQEPQGSFLDRVFVGGNFGFAFGDVDFVDVSPLFGYRFTDRVSGGLGVIYRYRNDKRFTPDLQTSDYGGRAFVRALVSEPFFAQAEYEYLDYEFAIGGEKFRDDFTSVLIGGGINQPIGRKSFLNFMVLYNVSYSDNDFPRPYNSPWVFRGGVGIGL